MYFSRWLRTDVLGCAGTLNVATLARVRTLDHANPRKGLRGNPAGTPKVATLPRARVLDHANPHKGLRGAPKNCNFTSRSRARPRQSMQRVARGPQKLQLYLAFARSTTPIHEKGCASRLKVATLPRVRALDHANPCKGLRVTLQVRSLDHANPRKGLRAAPTNCNFTCIRALDYANPPKGLHSRSMASVLVPALERKIVIPRCR